ncbi:chloramphenicol phosphotransferase CPT family protein [Armatimonas sp.]|uniref:chloramphenicol phosphotransferase CPT family protein n=1 Tax=Armatimonas sp. TaxID=1872638 RepID=UPI003753830B
MSGKIILVNGASSSGKSTLCRALQAALPELFWYLSIDHFRELGIVPWERVRSGEFDRQALRPALFEGFYRMLPALAEAGNNLLIEHILAPNDYPERLFEVLAPFEVFFVGVHCPLDELERRERERGDRPIGDARQDSAVTHTYGAYDIEVDSTQPVAENAATVITAWKARKVPTLLRPIHGSCRPPKGYPAGRFSHSKFPPTIQT